MLNLRRMAKERSWDQCLFKCNALIYEDHKDHAYLSQRGYFVSGETLNKINNVFKLYGLANSTKLEFFMDSLDSQTNCKLCEYHIDYSSRFPSIEWIYMKNVANK